MRTGVRAFTITELVVVIALIGALAALALARFVDLERASQVAAGRALAGSISSANALNIAACRVDSDDCIDIERGNGGDDGSKCRAEAQKIINGAFEVPELYNVESRVPSSACGDLPFRLNEVDNGVVTGNQVPANNMQTCVLRPVDTCP